MMAFLNRFKRAALWLAAVELWAAFGRPLLLIALAVAAVAAFASVSLALGAPPAALEYQGLAALALAGWWIRGEGPAARDALWRHGVPVAVIGAAVLTLSQLWLYAAAMLAQLPRLA